MAGNIATKTKKKRASANDLRRQDKNLRIRTEAPTDYLFIRANGIYVRISFSELICIRGKRGHVIVVTEKESFIIMNTLTELEEVLPKGLFCRVHYSYIVAVSRIKQFDNLNVYMYEPSHAKKPRPGLASCSKFPISQHYRKNLKESIFFLPSKTGRQQKELHYPEFLITELEDALVN